MRIMEYFTSFGYSLIVELVKASKPILGNILIAYAQNYSIPI